MKLHEVQGKYSQIRLATPQDNDAILTFLKDIPTEMEGLSFRFERTPDFFRFLKYQSAHTYAFIFNNRDGSMGGVATLSLKYSYLRGLPTPVMYLSDIRLHPKASRITRLQWRSFYTDIVRHAAEIEEFGGTRFLYTLVMDNNRNAIQAFTKGKSDFVYEALSSYDTVHLLARKPWGRAANGAVTSHRAGPEDLTALRAFLHHQNRFKILGHNFGTRAEDGGDELLRRFRDWDDFGVSNFIICRNEAGEILGVVAPWSTDHARRLVVENLPSSLQLVGKSLPLMGRPAVIEGQPLKLLTLTHLEVDPGLSDRLRCEVFRSMVDHMFDVGMATPYHLVAFPDFFDRSLEAGIAGYWYHKTPATLYQVRFAEFEHHALPPGESRRRPPAFEIAIP
jgi:hypothetical protein